MSEIDPLAVLGALGIADARAVEPVSRGSDSAIWRVERPAGVYALRLLRAGEDAQCEREVVAMGAAAKAGVPVPAIHAQGCWEGRPALLLSWCTGRPLADQLQDDPRRLWRLGAAFGQTQARIHRAPAPAVLYPEHARGWIAWTGSDEEPLQARLRALAGEATALLHLDYHLLNVMTDHRQVTGVLDWTNARAGDPRADLARTFTILCVEPDEPGAPLLWTVLLRRVLALAWQHGYRQAWAEGGDKSCPLDWSPEEKALFYAWAGTVMARDLAPKVGRPGVWLQPRHLDRIRRWAAHWKRRAGVPV